MNKNIFVKIKNDFPILSRKINGKPLVYLDNSATTQKPSVVINSLTKYYSNSNANIHRGIHTLAEESTKMYEDTRIAVTSFIGAKQSEIIFTKNATESINLVMRSWGDANVKKDNSILITDMEHHSDIVPWQYLAKKKEAKLLWLNITSDFKLDLIKLEEYLKTNHCSLVSVTHLSNVLGTINPINDIITLSHRYGAKVLIDACQSVLTIPLDVKSLDCDFLVFSSHKMFGPTGVGVLYVKEEIMDDMEPFLFGGDMISDVNKSEASWNISPYRFEAGTPNIADVIAFRDAIEYIIHLREKYGDSLNNEYDELKKYTLDSLLKISDLEIYGSKEVENRSSVFSFNLSGIHSHDIAQILDEDGIAIRSGMHCAHPLHKSLNINSSARVSLCYYNTNEDIDKLVDGLLIVQKKFNV